MFSAPMILQLIPAADRQRLIAEYVDRGGVWPVSSSPENARLLEFLASRLPAPSHALNLCRMEVALTRARLGAAIFVEPEYRSVQERSNRDVRARIEHEAWNCIERAMQGGVVTESWDHIERTSWDNLEGAIWDAIEREARLRLEFDAWQIVERSARKEISCATSRHLGSRLRAAARSPGAIFPRSARDHTRTGPANPGRAR
jgi:hypothetical protein